MPSRGYKQTIEHKKKITESHKGKKPSGKCKRKISVALKGRKLSVEHRRKLSEAHKGSKKPWAGKCLKSKEHREKISKAHSGKPKFWLEGDRNHAWKGGITPMSHKIRRSIEMKVWRKSVFERDNYTCQKCSQNGGKLRSHHIQNFAQWPELRFAIDNGITFCKNCHQDFHKIYGIKNNIKEQIDMFLAAKLNTWDKEKEDEKMVKLSMM